MTLSREFYQVTAHDLADPQTAANQLNIILSRIGDWLDRLEGLRDASVIREPLRVTDADENIIHSMGT